MSIRSIGLSATLAASLAAMPALAQPAATPAQATAAARDTAVEHRIAELHSKLQITAAEQKPFDDFAATMRENAQQMTEMVTAKRAGAATATAVDQMRAYAELAKAHADEVTRLVGPFSTLYDALSPDQRKMADQSFREFSSGRMNRTTRG